MASFLPMNWGEVDRAGYMDQETQAHLRGVLVALGAFNWRAGPGNIGNLDKDFAIVEQFQSRGQETCQDVA